MYQLPLFPRPVSWLSAGLLYFFLGLWTAFAATVVPVKERAKRGEV